MNFFQFIQINPGLVVRRLLGLPIRTKLYLIIGILIANIVVVIALGVFAFDTLSSIRASVAAEDMWAKSQKTAVYSLTKYAWSQDERAYQDYLEALKIPLAYGRANAELQKANPDRSVLDRAFLEAGIHPKDVAGVNNLFIYFKELPQVARAFNAWAKGQVLVSALQDLAGRLRTSVLAGNASKAEMANFVSQIDDLNHRLTALEITFASTLGEASRWAANLFTWLMIMGSLLIGFFSLTVAFYISSNIVSGIRKITGAASLAAAGDLKVQVAIDSDDELGKLATAFNTMVHGLGELDRLKSEFFANISHEFRTPLTLMLGPLEASLAHDPKQLTGVDRDNILVAHRNGMRLLSLVNALLDFSKIQAGKSQANFRPVDLAALTRNLASLFRSAIEKAGLEFVVDCSDLPESIFVDPEMWEKIILNLISNAFKFTLKGSIRVTLAVKNGLVELSVRDTGSGIPVQELPKIFDRFHRVEGAHGRTQEGSGIGLALVKELVLLHGGTIDVESRLNEGTTMTVRLACGKSHLPPNRVTTVSSPPLTNPADGTGFAQASAGWLSTDQVDDGATEGQALMPPTHRSRIILAEDNLDMRNYLRSLLAENWDVEVFADGMAVLERTRVLLPDLIVTDVMMPKLNGIELIKELRANPKTKDIPVVVLSACAGDEAKVEGIEMGAVEYLVKPFSAKELMARISRTLERHRENLDKLKMKNAELARSNAELEQFAYVASHDLRSPLKSIINWVQMLEVLVPQPRNEELNQALEFIQNNAHKANRLIENVMEMARVNVSTSPQTNLDLNAIVGGALTVLEKEIVKNEAKVICENLPTVEGVPAYLESIFMNLIQNALIYRHKLRRPEIQIGCRELEHFYEFFVKDNGIGIEPRQKDRIFRMFTRLHSGKEYSGGSGIGLAFSKKVIELSGGHIWVDSALGTGSTFYFTYPKR